MDAPLVEVASGEIEISLPGFERPIILKPNANAGIRLSRKFGGIRPLADRVAAYDFEAIIEVVAVAGGVTDKGMTKLPDAVFAAGVMNLAVPVTRFLLALANSGRPSVNTDTDEAADPSQ